MRTNSSAVRCPSEPLHRPKPCAVNAVTVVADRKTRTPGHEYGTEPESLRQYFAKMTEDPKLRLAKFPRAAPQVIRDGRGERGTTGEQAILSLGYPRTHRTPSIAGNEWTYWFHRWVTYKVQFDGSGVVSNVVGRPVLTQAQSIQANLDPSAVAPNKCR